MVNFVPKSIVKSAVRTLAAPMSLAEFNEVVDDIITNNPFSCTAYEVGGVSMPAVEKTRESYTARFVYEDNEAITIGTTSVKCPNRTAFGTVVTAVPAATAINNAIGATGVHATDDDSFSASIKCHAASGDIFAVGITRTAVTVSGYSADSILATVEDWADAVPQLG